MLLVPYDCLLKENQISLFTLKNCLIFRVIKFLWHFCVCLKVIIKKIKRVYKEKTMLAKLITLYYIIYLVNMRFANADKCTSLLKHLGITQSEFLRCVTDHSVPVRICNGCKKQYNDNLIAYDALANNCNTTYFDQDRINLVPSTETVLTGIWTKAFCDGMLYEI